MNVSSSRMFFPIYETVSVNDERTFAVSIFTETAYVTVATVTEQRIMTTRK